MAQKPVMTASQFVPALQALSSLLLLPRECDATTSLLARAQMLLHRMDRRSKELDLRVPESITARLGKEELLLRQRQRQRLGGTPNSMSLSQARTRASLVVNNEVSRWLERNVFFCGG